jgi:hypothetical protein
MSDRTPNLKFEAERLTANGRDLLDVAKSLAGLASTASNPLVAGELERQAKYILEIAEDVSSSAVRLVGR